MRKLLFLSLISILITGCQYSKSVKKDLISGLVTTGDGLSCENIYLSLNNERSEKNTFTYGEKLEIVFNDIKGFRLTDNHAFPDMSIAVTSQSGDTVFHARDLYSKFTEGVSLTPLKLTGTITLANPIHSGAEYQLSVLIRDKRGTGMLSSRMKFSLKKDERIKIDPEGTSCREIYFFSSSREAVITNGKINYNDEVYLIAEGISGFKEENGMVFPGLSLIGNDSSGIKILNYSDLYGDYSNKGLSSGEFGKRVAVHFKITGSGLKNPFHTELVVWDKKSSARLKATADLEVE